MMAPSGMSHNSRAGSRRRAAIALSLVALLAVATQAGLSGAQSEEPAWLMPGEVLTSASLQDAYDVPAAGPARLDYRLWRLAMVNREQGQAAARAYAAEQRIPMRGGNAVVLIHEHARIFREERASTLRGRREEGLFTPENPANEVLFAAVEQAISSRVEALGGAVHGRVLNMIEATVPLANLTGLAGANEIGYTEPSPRPHVDMVVSQGVAVTGADRFQQSTGSHFPLEEKVQVGVLDVGFRGYAALVGSELPGEVSTQTFSSGGIGGGGLDPISRQHGTAVAEIVFDMAPDAALLLTNIDTLFGHSQATSWLLSNGVNVINSSLSWFNVGPGDGTGPVNFDVERAAESDVVWVTSAGNMAQRHWDGRFRDPDGDGWNNFSGSAETNPALLAADGSLTVYLNWDDWFTSNQDYDLYVFFECSNTEGAPYPCDESSVEPPSADRPLVLAGVSLNPQKGTEAPVEQVTVTAGDASVVAHVAIRRASGSRDVQLETFYVGDILTTPAFVVPAGSITIPADSRSAVAVGATYWSNDSLEPFSSWGPTTDGRSKPDIVAPDGVITVTYGPLSFYGTSASAPHVAGAIALLKSRTGLYSYDQIVRILYGRALDLGPPGSDNRYGAGRLSIDP